VQGAPPITGSRLGSGSGRDIDNRSDSGDDLLIRSARSENDSNSFCLHSGHVDVGHNAAHDNWGAEPCVTECVHYSGGQCEVRTVVHRHANDIHVLLGGRRDDHLWGLTESGKDDFETRVTQDSSDNPEPAIVTI